MTTLRNQIGALQVQNDSERQQRISDWIPSDTDRQLQNLTDKAERIARDKIDREIQQGLADNDASNELTARLRAVYAQMLSQRKRMDISEEARRTQDTTSLAETAAASSATGPDYTTVGKRGKHLKPRSPKYNISILRLGVF